MSFSQKEEQELFFEQNKQASPPLKKLVEEHELFSSLVDSEVEGWKILPSPKTTITTTTKTNKITPTQKNKTVWESCPPAGADVIFHSLFYCFFFSGPACCWFINSTCLCLFLPLSKGKRSPFHIFFKENLFFSSF